MKLYKIIWKANIYGESEVEASSEEEAKRLALEGKDRDFKVITDRHYVERWDIDEIEEIEELDE